MAPSLKRAPRVLFITPFGFQRHGTLSYRTMPMAVTLDHMGVRVRILVANWDAASPPHITYSDVSERIRIYYVPLRRREWRVARTGDVLLAWGEMLAAVRSLVSSQSPDIIHLVKPIGIPFAFLALQRLFDGLKRAAERPPILLDCDDLEQAWLPEGRVRHLWRYMGSWAESWAWRAADAVTVASHDLLTRVHQKRKDGRVYLIPNVAPVVPEPDRPRHSHRLLVPTRLLDIRPEVLVLWLNAIVRRVSDANVLVVGPTPQRAMALRASLVGMPAASRTTVLVWQSYSAFVQLLRRTRVGVYAVEDAPTTRAKSPARLLHMMAAGVPIVAARVGEAPYLLDASGRLAQPDANSMAAAVEELWYDADLLEHLGQAARHRAQTRFTLEQMAQSLARAYNALL